MDISPDIARTVLIALQKGGTTKTTSVAEIGYAAARLGARVLLVDFAPNANLTQTLMGFDPTGDFLTSADIIATGQPDGAARDAVSMVPDDWQLKPDLPWAGGGVLQAGGALGIIPGSPALQKAADQEVIASELRLQRALSGVASLFDLVLVDSDPTTGKASQLATLAAGWQIGPILPSSGAIDGALTQIRFLEAFAAGWRHPVRFAGAFCAAYDRRLTVAHGKPLAEMRELLDNYEPSFPDATGPQPIPGLAGWETARLFPQIVPNRAAALAAAQDRRPVAGVPGGADVANVYAQLAIILLHLVEAPIVKQIVRRLEESPLPGVWPLTTWDDVDNRGGK